LAQRFFSLFVELHQTWRLIASNSIFIFCLGRAFIAIVESCALRL